MLELLYFTLSVCAFLLVSAVAYRIAKEHGPLIVIHNQRTTIVNRHPKEEDTNK